MSARFLWVILSFILLMGCQVGQNNNPIEKEIKKLTTTEAKKKYLENLFEEDQKYRRGAQEGQIIIKHGNRSKEHQDFTKKAMEQDVLNMKKVEKYLKIHGHPDLATFGELATVTPHIVIHHAPKYEDRVRNFKYFYPAHVKGDIDLDMYLGRMYEMKFGERLVIQGAYQPEDEINQLIEKLGLQIPE